MRALRLLLLLVLVVVAGGAFATWYTWRDLHTPAAPPAGGATISVAPGTPFRSVAIQLQRAGILRHPLVLAAWARYRGLDRSVRSGDYVIDSPMTPLEVLAMLRSPSRALQWVTVPEGYTAAQAATLLEQEGFGGADLMLCAMHDPVLLRELDLPATGVEGYLFPDTYALPWTTEPAEIIRTMVTRFREQSRALSRQRIAAGLTEEEMVILASVIEKETGRAAERRLISGVFHNRLRRGMPLQSDPTVIYGLEKFGDHLTRADLEAPSPYNTYLVNGLPVGPIANPGRAALEAAVSPIDTDALYFVSRNDGTHQFSASLGEHNAAVQRYQRGSRPAE